MKALFSNKLFLAISLLILVAAIPLTILFLRQQQETRSRATGGNVLFSFNPPAGEIEIGQTFDVQLAVNTSGNAVTGIDFSLVFNQDIIAVEFAPTNVFNQQLINNSNNTTGLLRYAAVDTAGKTINGSDILLGTIRLTAKSVGSASLAFQTVKVVVYQYNGLFPTGPLPTGTYVVSLVPTSTPTPTPLPSVTPEPSPTATPTLTPLPTPTSTPVPQNTPTPTPSPTPTSTPAPAPGDANGDGQIDLGDFNIWRDEFLGVSPTKSSDFSGDGTVDLGDFNMWRDAFLGV